MGSIGRGTETYPRVLGRERPRESTTLSVCCMTSGRRPHLLAGVLAPFRELATEIVVAVESQRASEVHAAVAGIADTVLAFPPTQPSDRPIAWLFRTCGGDWILNIDDDEVPSPALLGALPVLLARRDVTHAWIARRWVYPNRATHIASAPWGTEFQLRLVLADERFLQFSDVFHRPVVCHGPSVYVDAPLWHLDTLLSPAAHRRRKASAYDQERPGMRIAGVGHNIGIYVPELRNDLELAPVPGEDRAAIATALAFRNPGGQDVMTTFGELPTEIVDREWVGAPFADDLYRGQLSIPSAPSALFAGTQATVDVRVTNRGGTVWRWGREARPQILLGYTWRRDGKDVPNAAALRTTLPVDVPPGASEVVPVHVVTPSDAGRYDLEIDLVHEGVRSFGVPVALELDVRPLRRIALIADPGRLPALSRELDLPPDAELVALLRDEVDRGRYGDHRSVVGLRPYLLSGNSTRGRLRTLGSLLSRTAAVASSSSRWSRPAYRELLALRRDSDGLIVDSPNWKPDAAFGREWAWVAATALLWRLDGKRALVREEALPGGTGVRERAVRGLLRALSR